jgi:type II secretory pathway component PulC
MNIASQQRTLYAIAGSCLLGTVGAVYWAVSGVTAGDPSSRSVTADRSAVGDAPQDSESNRSDAALAISLRGPLYDPPPPAPRQSPVVIPQPSPPPVQKSLPLSLVGTLIDDQQSLAIVSDASGKFDVKGVGDALELTPAGVQIQEIAAEQITLRYQGNVSTIRLKKSRQPEAAGRRGNNNRRRNP